MSFNDKIYEIVKQLGEEVKNVRTEEDKKAFGEKYGAPIPKVDEICEAYRDWQYREDIYNNTVKTARESTSGIDFSTDIGKTRGKASDCFHIFRIKCRKNC